MNSLADTPAVPSTLLDADRAAADPVVAEQRARILVGSPSAEAEATATTAINAAMAAAHSGPDRAPLPGVRVGALADNLQDALAVARVAFTGLPRSDVYLHQFHHAADQFRDQMRAEARAVGRDEDQAAALALVTLRAIVRSGGLPVTADETTPAQVRRRHLASLRVPPLACGHRDPVRCLAAPTGRSSFGLTARELLAERSRLLTAGWTPDEIDARLNLREAIAA